MRSKLYSWIKQLDITEPDFCRSSSTPWQLAPHSSNISVRTPPKQRSSESCCGPPAGFGALSTIPMHLWASVDTRGSHALSCRRNPGRSQWHHFVNDLIWRSLSKAGYPSIKEPQGHLRADGKRPDGLTLTSWKDGRCATWDVTVTDTVAASYLSATCAGSAAETAAKRKEDK